MTNRTLSVSAIAAPRSLMAFFAAIACVLVAPPAMAQDSVSDARIRKIESEIRALQRKVFPGADGRYFEPEITAPQEAAPPPPAATANNGAVSTDILQRLTALERQLQRLTAQNEETQNAMRLLGERVEALEAMAAAAQPLIDDLPTEGPIGAVDRTTEPAGDDDAPAPQIATVSAPSPERLAKVEAVAKPASGDAGDDEYVYGFRLWEAGLYPEAQQQLTKFVEAYPSHSRISYGRNLLGRAYLDDNKPRDAASWFLSNYNSNKQGARAPDSLLYLAKSMIALTDTERACIALAEFGETYPAVASGRLQSDYEGMRRQVTCN